MRVADEFDQLRARINQLKDTKCAGCGHPFIDHGGRCYYPRTQRLEGPPVKRCRCKWFVDADEVLT